MDINIAIVTLSSNLVVKTIVKPNKGDDFKPVCEVGNEEIRAPIICWIDEEILKRPQGTGVVVEDGAGREVREEILKNELEWSVGGLWGGVAVASSLVGEVAGK
ncbi:Uncharacterized protein Fot_31347 [Forsythia ovata]|uniref:Uncharacterized protein n=1 Tax=Forsythia ovata TaxID=205694 RepID=A0ABD1T4S1_9LAMI